MTNWLSTAEIAAYLGISKETIHRLLARKIIPAHRLGKLWKFNTKEIDAWLMRKNGTKARKHRN
jgi:excisionase family DNA binding protein